MYFEDQNRQDLLYCYELRELIESGAARLAAMNMNGHQIQRLRDLARRVEECFATGDREARYQAAIQFHDYILANCGNPHLLQVWESHRLGPLRTRSSEMEARFTARMSDDDYHALMHVVDAIAAHDPDRAETLMRKHVRHVTEIVRKIVTEHEDDSDMSSSTTREALPAPMSSLEETAMR